MKKPIVIALIILYCSLSTGVFADIVTQADTVQAPNVSAIPVVDGDGSDPCWNDCDWQTIDQVWIEYGQLMDPADFSGRYKMAWSSSSNLLYFLVEIVDDAFVDGYVYDSNPSVGGGYPNYDIVEVFIDPDKSGGLHVFDGTGSVAQQWGTNAENAFSHHITVNLPEEGQPVTEKVVCDIAGVDWGNYFIPDYADHFPEFAMRQADGKYIWEFSMKVFDDGYDANNPSASRINLQTGEIMGLSIAYCDNDDPDEDPKTRDHFIGSVWVPEEAYNDHWMNADGFGTVLLTEGLSSVSGSAGTSISGIDVYPNPGSGILNFRLPNSYIGNATIRIFNILGQKVFEINDVTHQAMIQKQISLKNVPPGIYILYMEIGHQVMTRKFTLIKD